VTITGEASVMLAAGGTGGHLFPAFALAEVLMKRGIAVDLVTDTRGDRYGTGFPARSVYQVPSATVGGKNPITAAYAAVQLSRGIAAAHKMLGEVRPSAIVGFGGYPTFPPLLAAKLRGIPTLVHEQNAVLGRANRMLSGRVDAIATSFVTTKFLDGALEAKSRHTGNPVRAVVITAAARHYWRPEPGQPVQILVFGGSQGARYFSDTVPPALAQLPESMRSRLRITQQAREEDVARVQSAYAASGIAAEVATFFKDLPNRMGASHLVIGRAGASTVAELTVIGRPAIMVPLPHSLDNDQLYNARMLAESGGGWCIEQKDLTPERLGQEIATLIERPSLLANAATAAKSQGRPDAVDRLADLVVELMAKPAPAKATHKSHTS
jgi:UDP-N-acetylglucosamine--N-acetylmuramyl-(pentapeptide) pyrophosphoryl-undecaprenol N-acetylglucosamine transferase